MGVVTKHKKEEDGCVKDKKLGATNKVSPSALTLDRMKVGKRGGHSNDVVDQDSCKAYS